MLSSTKLCIFLSRYDEEALDFILAASNLTDNISVIFIESGVLALSQYKALHGFEIHEIYAEKKTFHEHQLTQSSLEFPISLLSLEDIQTHVAHCDKIFAY
jgi:sulfur relay (sulfurtransferase) DsrF/TusC family protein